MRLIIAAAITLFFAGCLSGEDADTDAPSVRSEVKAILSAPTGPEGADEEYEVYVTHAGLPPETVERLLGNIDIRPLEVQYETVDADVTRVPSADLHWVDPALHDFHVRVRRATRTVDASRFEWFWADHAIAVEHCPPGH